MDAQRRVIENGAVAVRADRIAEYGLIALVGGVAAKKLGRHSLGVEINPVFCDLTVRNLQTVELAAAS